jgi:hypothetical protein
MSQINLTDISLISDHNFENTALDVFRYQFTHCEVYRRFCRQLGKEREKVTQLNQIPFMPTSAFKSHRIIDTDNEPALIFESSGTTGQLPARHYVRDAGVYEQSFLITFQQYYGSPNEYCILALLPTYLQRKHSSLVYMTDTLMKISAHPNNGFFLDEFSALSYRLKANEASGQKTILLGVSYALLDFSESYPLPLKHTIVMETGGMKGKRPELPRTELHRILKQHFQLDHIHSEYGMTELLSQAYSKSDGIFKCPPHMRILIREEDDPLTFKDATNLHESITGPINIIDLANRHSCSFIATEDLGRLDPDGSFEVLGRVQDSDIRGCGLMYG